MSALVTHVWTVELAPTEWITLPAAVHRDSEEHGVKQVSALFLKFFGEVACKRIGKLWIEFILALLKNTTFERSS